MSRWPKVLITGGTGFVGHWLHQTWKEALGNSSIHWLSSREYYTLWELDNWDYIFHLAPVPTERVIACAQRCHARVLFASSGAVYDEQLSCYGKAKQKAEQALWESGIDCVVARIFSATGKKLCWNKFAIGMMLHDAYHGGPVAIPGRPEAVRSYLYGSDLGEWLWKLILEGGRMTYDVGSPCPVTMDRLAHEIAGDLEIIAPCPDKIEPRQVYLPHHEALPKLPVKVSFQEAVQRSKEDYAHDLSRLRE